MSDTALPNEPVRIEKFGAEPAKPRKKRRIFMWFFLAVQALFIIWIITGISAAGDAVSSCDGETFTEFYTREDCEAATGVGAGIGFMLIVGLWVAVDFILGVAYAIRLLATRNR